MVVGGVGGVFAPSLFTGGVAGYLLAMLITMSGIRIVEPSHFVLAGMAGTMSGVMKAPLTAMFLIAEISGRLCLISTFDVDLGYFLPDQSRDGTLFYLCPSFSHAGRLVDS